MLCTLLYEAGFPIEYRTLEARLYGNASDNIRGVYRNGWIAKDKKHYFRAKATHFSHKPFTLRDFLGHDITTFNVILAGFELTKSEKLDSRTLQTIGDYLAKEDVVI